MKLSFDQIKQITKGAVYFSEVEGGYRLHRFTKEQEQLYENTNEAFYDRTFASSGMRFHFVTDSKTLFLKMFLEKKGCRTYFSTDVFVDGKPIGYLDNFSDVDLPQNYTEVELSLGEVEKIFELGEGVKTVTVYLPWNTYTLIKEVALDEGSFIEPINISKKVLVYGDSITQGFDALRPSNRYAGRIADFLNAEEINKAIGGEFFFPALVETEEDFYPDYVTVAYGTNDWSKTDEPGFRVRSRKFYEILSKKYPKTQIFAITPIWRKDYQEYREFGLFEDMIKDIEKAVDGLENVHLIHGFDFVPKDENYYADLRLHPNDEGFDFYFEGLKTEIQKYI